MAEKFLGCLRVLIAVLFNRPLEVRMHRGKGTFYPWARVALPIISGASDGSEDDGGDEDDGNEDGDEDDGDDDAGDEDDDGDEVTPEKLREAKKHSRKHERRWKKERDERKRVEAELRDRENESKSETQKKIDEAREEGKHEAQTAAEKERRQDRLEISVARLASKPVKIGKGEKAETKRFNDPEEAQLFIDRAIADGDLEADDVFDDNGKVNKSVVSEFLAELLTERPHLAVGVEAVKKIPNGGGDGGRGEDDSPDESGDMNALLRRRR